MRAASNMHTCFYRGGYDIYLRVPCSSGDLRQPSRHRSICPEILPHKQGYPLPFRARLGGKNKPCFVARQERGGHILVHL
ncbi:unnamed protein product [Hapterophycus canaliculatus]